MNKLNNYLYISNNFITNFKPSLINNFKNYNNFKHKNKQKYCKNFLIYLLLFKYKNSTFFKKSEIFIKKHKKRVYTILRSPYRHKLARHQIYLNRYKINFSLIIPLKYLLFLKNFNNFLKIINILKNFSNVFESNIIYINNINISLPFFYDNIFIIGKY